MTDKPLKILHVMRAPVGGLFRHVLDVAQGQAARGHQVGIVTADAPPGSVAEAKLQALAPSLALGISSISMQRQVGLGDAMSVRHVSGVVNRHTPDVVHGHGAKGGAFARGASTQGIRAYTPHGGSLHYGRFTPQGMVYGLAERLLMLRTNLFLFESKFARQTFESVIGKPRATVRVVHNGVAAPEFETVPPDVDATDLVTIGELRHIKGIDVLIEAVASMNSQGRKLSLTIVGDGPDAAAFRQLVAERGLSGAVRFAGYQPARKAFGFGRLLIVPSRAESLPYIVLEAGAAGVPMIATHVGGIPEIFDGVQPLVAPGDAAVLASAIGAALDDLPGARIAAGRLRERIRENFSQDSMVNGVLAAYREAIAAKFHRSH